MKTLVISLLFVMPTLPDQQSPSAESNETACKAYLDQDLKHSKEQWRKIVSEINGKAVSSSNENMLYEAALLEFGLLSATMRDRDEDLFEEFADVTEEKLQTLIDHNKSWAEPRALMSALLGLKMGYSPIKGMFLGPKSQSLMERALKDAPDSPLIWKLYGNSKFFTPESFGGDIQEAIRAYEKAITLYEKHPEKIKNNWFYLDTMAFLGQAYLKNSQAAKAVSVYEKALKAEPNFGWVKFNLIPRAKKSIVSK